MITHQTSSFPFQHHDMQKLHLFESNSIQTYEKSGFISIGRMTYSPFVFPQVEKISVFN